MKTIKFIFVIFLLFNFSGCFQETNHAITATAKGYKKIKNYQLSDEVFNRNFSSDEKGNCYFLAGNYFYQLDSQNNLKKGFYRLIDDKYIYHAKYYNGKIYCLVFNLNHQNNSTFSLATINPDGNNFQYLNDLTFSNQSIGGILNFRIINDNIYIYALDQAIYYVYSLKQQAVIAMKDSDINNERNTFYKNKYPDYPYEKIDHIDNNNLYTVIKSKNKDKAIIQYNYKNKKEKTINLQEYFDPNVYNIDFYVDLIDNQWFLFSNKGIFKFDYNFENVQQLLDETIFENNQLW